MSGLGLLTFCIVICLVLLFGAETLRDIIRAVWEIKDE